MSAQPQSFLTAQDYLVWERQQETRHEYFYGQIFAKTGASRAHNVLCANVLASLHGQLRGKPCEVYTNNMRVKVSETGMHTYPDLVFACREPRFEDQAVDTLLNPVLIIEVLPNSPTTAHSLPCRSTCWSPRPSAELNITPDSPATIGC
jgi:Uma2 family endonuclease